MYAPGHFTKNQYGSFGAMKGYQDQQQQQRNQMTVGGSTGGQGMQQQPTDPSQYTEQLMSMLAGGNSGGSTASAPRQLYGSSNAPSAATGGATGTAPVATQYTQIVPTSSGLPGAQPAVDQYTANMDAMMSGAGGPLTKALRGMQARGGLELQRLINPAQSELDFLYSRAASDEGIGQQRYLLNRQQANQQNQQGEQNLLLSLLMGGI